MPISRPTVSPPRSDPWSPKTTAWTPSFYVLWNSDLAIRMSIQDAAYLGDDRPAIPGDCVEPREALAAQRNGRSHRAQAHSGIGTEPLSGIGTACPSLLRLDFLFKRLKT